MTQAQRRNPVCPRCGTPLVAQNQILVCSRCLIIWHGDTFEPLTGEALGLASLYDYFFLS